MDNKPHWTAEFMYFFKFGCVDGILNNKTDDEIYNEMINFKKDEKTFFDTLFRYAFLKKKNSVLIDKEEFEDLYIKWHQYFKSVRIDYFDSIKRIENADFDEETKNFFKNFDRRYKDNKRRM